jgi:hypothetical protein
MRFHDLRHTTASYLAAQGASLLEIANTLGHRTMAVVKLYSHLAQQRKVTVLEKMTKERGIVKYRELPLREDLPGPIQELVRKRVEPSLREVHAMFHFPRADWSIEVGFNFSSVEFDPVGR